MRSCRSMKTSLNSVRVIWWLSRRGLSESDLQLMCFKPYIIACPISWLSVRKVVATKVTGRLGKTHAHTHTHVHVTCLKCWFVVGSMLFLLCCMACLAFHICGVPSGAAHRRCASWHLRYGVFKWCVLNCLTVCFSFLDEFHLLGFAESLNLYDVWISVLSVDFLGCAAAIVKGLIQSCFHDRSGNLAKIMPLPQNEGQFFWTFFVWERVIIQVIVCFFLWF